MFHVSTMLPYTPNNRQQVPGGAGQGPAQRREWTGFGGGVTWHILNSGAATILGAQLSGLDPLLLF